MSPIPANVLPGHEDCWKQFMRDDKRIRELEAELARLAEAGLTVPEARKEWQEMKARAEKAEKALADMDKPWSANYWYVAWKESQARFAELERTIRENADASRLASEASPGRHSRRTDTRSPGAQFEPREQEAE